MSDNEVLLAELRQCAVELEEAGKLLRGAEINGIVMRAVACLYDSAAERVRQTIATTEQKDPTP